MVAWWAVVNAIGIGGSHMNAFFSTPIGVNWNGVGPGEKLLVRNTASCMAIRIGRRMTASIGSFGVAYSV